MRIFDVQTKSLFESTFGKEQIDEIIQRFNHKLLDTGFISANEVEEAIAELCIGEKPFGYPNNLGDLIGYTIGGDLTNLFKCEEVMIGDVKAYVICPPQPRFDKYGFIIE